MPTAANQTPDTNNYQTDTPATITTGTKLAMAGVGLAAVGIGGFLIVKRMNNNHSSRKDKSPVKHKHSKLQGLGKIHWN